MRGIYVFLLSLCPVKREWDVQGQLEPTAGPVDRNSAMLCLEKEITVSMQ